jgi:hypothetical protein
MVKRHPMPLQEMMKTYRIKPEKMEKIEVARQDLKWEMKAEVRIAGMKEEAILEEGHDGAEVKVYLDGSGIDGKIGVVAVLYRNGQRKSSMQYRLGPERRHTVYEGEGTGIVVGLELIRAEHNVHIVTMCVDSQLALKAMRLIQPALSHHIWDMFHERLQMVEQKH